jgi:hypothetical protein
MLAALSVDFATQRDMLRHFRVDCERFRPAPPYDFAKPPNGGCCWYDRFGWPITRGRR